MLIYKCKSVGLKHCNDSKAFIEYSNDMDDIALHQKTYLPSPGISWKAQKYQGNIVFPSTFWIKRRPHLPSTKSSKQELFSNQQTWYSMLKKYNLIVFLRTERSSFSALKISWKFRKC